MCKIRKNVTCCKYERKNRIDGFILTVIKINDLCHFLSYSRRLILADYIT